MADNKKIKRSNIGSTDMSKRLFVARVAIIVMLILLQILFLIIVYGIARSYVFYWRTSALLLTAFVVLYLVNKPENPAYKLAWVVFVMAVPLVGGIMYIMLSGNRTRMKFIKEAKESYVDIFKYMPRDESVQKEIKAISKSASVQSTYISQNVGFPAYKNTNVKYFSSGEENFSRLKNLRMRSILYLWSILLSSKVRCGMVFLIY